MARAVSCGGVVIREGKILLLYKNFRNRYDGWVMPKGTVEEGEQFRETALREVREEAGIEASIVSYIGKSQYSFNTFRDTIAKEVHWFLMKAPDQECRPQYEEYFEDAGYYKYHEAIHLLKYSNERQILEKAYKLYKKMENEGIWTE